MRLTERLKISAATTGILVGLLVIFDMAFHFDIGETVFSLLFIIPILVVMFILAPTIARFIRFK